MVNFPTSKDDSVSLPNPSSGANTNSPSHSALHTSENAAIIAIESKVGTGSSLPASNTLLVGTGAGTSAWQGLTSAQLAAILSDETGGGAAVFANTPTLITPKVDTINENTAGNGVTVAGLNIKSGALNTSNSVPGSALQAGSVTPDKLISGAATSWAWQSWTPTLTNLSGGTVNYSTYAQHGKTVLFKLKYTMSGANVSGSVSFTLPVTAASNNDNHAVMGGGFCNVSSGTYNLLSILYLSSTTAQIVANSVSTYVQAANLSSTVPITWASGSVLAIQGAYEAA